MERKGERRNAGKSQHNILCQDQPAATSLTAAKDPDRFESDWG
jgi:hypothetical protein